MDTNNRNATIDILRGFAFVSMLLVGTAIFYVNDNYPFFLRAVNSIAAPLFIAISGYLLGLNLKEKYSKTYFKRIIFRRSGLLFLAGALLDILAWNIVPVISCNILFPIAIALLLSPLFYKIGKYWHFVIVLIIMLIPLYSWWVYHPDVYIVKLSDYQDINLIRVIESILVDGWFPFFPWVGLFLLAFWFGIYGDIITTFEYYNNACQVILAIIILISSLIFMSQRVGFERLKYAVVYYPPDFSYLMSALAFFYLILNIPKKFFKNKIFKPLMWLGRSTFPLFLIFVSTVYTLYPLVYQFVGNIHFLAVILFFIFFLLMAYGIYRFKKTSLWKKMPYLVRFLLGS